MMPTRDELTGLIYDFLHFFSIQQLLKPDQRKALSKAQINTTQEELVGFILDEIIAEHGEFYDDVNKRSQQGPWHRRDQLGGQVGGQVGVQRVMHGNSKQ